MPKRLMPWAEREAFQFYLDHGRGNCSCHISPPCSSCVHPGNPRNLECADDAWGEEYEVMAAKAKEELETWIEYKANVHLNEMKLSWETARK